MPACVAASVVLAAGCSFGSSSTPGDAGGFDAGFDTAVAFDAGSDAREAEAEAEAAAPCTPTGAPVTHSADVTADETWASGIHVVPSSISVKNGARLTIAACSQVQLGKGASISLQATAAGLDVVGTASSPITFVASQAGTPWGVIDVVAPAVAHLAYATLSGGGNGPQGTALYGGATIAAHGGGTQRPVALKLEHVTISGSAGLGVFLVTTRFDPASTALTVTGSGWYPVYLGAASAGDLPDGAYTGNAIDQILLQTFGPAAYDDSAAVAGDVTLHDRGVPYLVGTTPAVIKVGDGLGGSPPASLTIAAGVKVLFTPQGASSQSGIVVNAQPTDGGYGPQGALIVQGTSASPVVLDSAAATPAAGDWMGINFHSVVDPRTSIAYARVLHAGGASGDVGTCGSTPTATNGGATCAIDMLLLAPPPAFLSNSHIEAAPCGVYRGWTGKDVDFVTGNTFATVPGCTQTLIPSAVGACTGTCPTSP